MVQHTWQKSVSHLFQYIHAAFPIREYNVDGQRVMAHRNVRRHGRFVVDGRLENERRI